MFNCNLHFVSNHFTNLLIVSILESISENENDLENRDKQDSYTQYFRLLILFGEDETKAHKKILEIVNNNDINEIIDDEIDFLTEAAMSLRAIL